MADVWKKTLERLSDDPSFKNMFHMMELYAGQTAAEMTDSDGKKISRTYKEYVEMSYDACAAVQKYCGNAEGEIVGLIYETCMDWPILFWGILMAGKIPLLLNPSADIHLLNDIMAEAKASAYVAARPVANCDIKYIPAESILSEHGGKYTEKWGQYVALCTSGTTGNSRIFLFDGQTISNHILSFDEAKKVHPDMPFIEGYPCKVLAFLPFHHIFGLSAVYILYSCTGKTLVYLPNKSAQTILSTCREHGVTHLYCIPMFFNLLADGIKKNIGGRDPSGLSKIAKLFIRKKTLGLKIRSMITGGGHIPQSTLEIINGVGYPLCNGFGMTETGIVSVEKSLDNRQRIKGSIGYPFSITQWKIDSENAGPGELLLKGDALFSASIINGEIVPREKSQWFATGDIVLDKGDGLYMVGRVKDVIIGASGENIYPDELEDTFAGIEGIKNYCILGIKNGIYDDVSIVVEPEEKYDSDRIVNAVKLANGNLPLAERVSKVIISGRTLPISGNMKVKRQQLKKQIESGEWPCEVINPYSGKVQHIEGKKSKAQYEDTDEFKAILRDVRLTAAEVFNIEIRPEDIDAHFAMELGGNSLELLSLFAALEEKYNVVFSNDEMMALENCRIVAKVIYCKKNGLESPLGNLASGSGSLTEEEIRATKRITDFSQSAEYIAFKERMRETFKDGCNPYFIAHDSVIRDTSVIGGRELINLGSYNYLGMSGNPETMQAAIDAIRKYGTSASGSRVLAGEKTLYQELEKTIAEWKHTDDSIVCTGGWATNLAFISCFAKKGDFIVYDKLSHNSITEGVKLSDAESKAFEHNNLKQLENILKSIEGKYNKVLIVVEGVYSMDGDIAPIPEFVALKKKYKAFLMVDEAHSACVIGEHGGGVDEYFNLDPRDIDIKYGTLSKGLGACGGYIAADASIIEYLRYQMNGFVFTAGIAPPLAAEVMKAIEIIRRDNSMVKKLHENIEYFHRRAKEEGMDTGLSGGSAIVPVIIGSDAEAAYISAKLIEQGVFVPPAMYPAVPMGKSRLRFTISATHSREQLEKAITATAQIMRERGLLK